uniref:Rhs family protein n=1 Tax=Rheinheimera sp. BAL341 TaxID=1708203 RepID=A0A486XHW7_9GAMM
MRSGDTLQSIAQLYYGSSDYWYIIASANGLSNDSPLQESTTLDIPARANTENSSDSFKPMQLAQIIGDTTPTLPYVPAPSDAGCGTVGTIIMVAVAVALTVVTAGAAAAAMTPGLAAGWSTGAAALIGGGATAMTTGVAMASAAIGGFVGSVGSQLVGKAMGVVDSFSLKGALASGLTAGVTAGAGAALQSVGTVFGQSVMHGDKLNALGRGIQAGTAAAGSVAANKLVGNQASFSWRDVATSAVSAYAGTRLFGDNPALAGVTSGDIVRDTFGGIAHAAIGYGAGKLIQKSGDRPSWNFSNVATDSFGNALGNSFVASRRSAEQTRQNATLAASAMGQIASDHVNGNFDAQFATDQKTFQTNLDKDNDKWLQQQLLSTVTDLNKLQDIEDAKRADQTLARIEAVNAQSAALQTHANEMQQHFDASMKYRQESTDFALKEALARGGNATFTGQKRQDLMAGVDVEGNIAWAIQRREAAYSSVGLGAGAANGSFGDFATWYGAALVNESWQALQFMGKAVVNGLTLGAMNDRFSPLSSGYHSLIGDNTLFGNPTTFAGAVGLKSGVYGSYGLDPLAAVGALGKLSKFDFNLSLNGTPVQRFSGNNGSYLVEEEFVFGKASQFNLEAIAKGDLPAYMPNTVAWETSAHGDLRVNIALSRKEIEMGYAGGWSTPAEITSVKFARENLAIIPKFKDDISGARAHLIKDGSPIRVGVVGSQTQNGVFYRGGEIQFEHLWHFTENDKYLPAISKPWKLK